MLKDRGQVTHQHLLRSMDVRCEHREAPEEAVGGSLPPLLDQDLSVVFYDLTRVRIHGGGGDRAGSVVENTGPRNRQSETYDANCRTTSRHDPLCNPDP